jgi:hypothetical protein
MTSEQSPDRGRPPRAEQQGDGQPENERELRDPAGGSALDAAGQPGGGGGEDTTLPESGMGGTSDAGSAADDAIEAANYERGLPTDRTRGGDADSAAGGS